MVWIALEVSMVWVTTHHKHVSRESVIHVRAPVIIGMRCLQAAVFSGETKEEVLPLNSRHRHACLQTAVFSGETFLPLNSRHRHACLQTAVFSGETFLPLNSHHRHAVSTGCGILGWDIPPITIQLRHSSHINLHDPSIIPTLQWSPACVSQWVDASSKRVYHLHVCHSE